MDESTEKDALTDRQKQQLLLRAMETMDAMEAISKVAFFKFHSREVQFLLLHSEVDSRGLLACYFGWV